MKLLIILLSLITLASCTKKESQVKDAFDIDSYIEEARKQLEIRSKVNNRVWSIGSADSWNVNQETGIITWTLTTGVKVQAPFQIIGTYNTLDSTFLWGWDHPSVLKPLSNDANAVLRFAKKHNIEFLQKRKVVCSEEAAWDLVALATQVCKRHGAYRGPSGTTYVFMTFDKIERTNEK